MNFLRFMDINNFTWASWNNLIRLYDGFLRRLPGGDDGDGGDGGGGDGGDGD